MFQTFFVIFFLYFFLGLNNNLSRMICAHDQAWDALRLYNQLIKEAKNGKIHECPKPCKFVMIDFSRRIVLDNWRSSLENSSNIPKSVTLTKVWSFLLNLVDIWDCFLVCLWTKCLTWLHHLSNKSKQFWNSIEWFWQNNTIKITFWCQGLFYPRNFFIILGTFWC